MEKIFCETKGKKSSSGARRRGMVRRDVEITLVVDKWEMGWGDMPLGWAGWGAERAHGLFTPLPLFSCPQKVITETEIASKDKRES